MSTALVPDKILHDLSAMWMNLAKQDAGAHAGMLRACSLTLVVLAAPGEDAAALGETLAAIMPRHPARAIVIRLGGSEGAFAGVTAQCWMPFGQRREICSEQIEITAAENALDDIASVLGPIAAPDLPLILWCRGHGLLGLPSFRRLAALATRVLVDSAQSTDPKAAIRMLAELGRGVPIGDLAWTRLTRWREMLAGVFENTQYTERIPEITNLEITYGGAAAPVEAYYMGAWLMDAMRRAGAHAELALASDAGAEANRLQTVKLSGGAFHLSLSRLRETLVTTVEGVSRCIPFKALTDRLLMSEELDITGADPVFDRILAAATKL
jgi:glucose-6-phosphate dehydrogenase assembly protein OpcA